MSRFDVIVYTIRRRRGRRRPFEVRWRAVGRARSKSFITRALADSYRAELVRAARKGLEFDPQTGEPVLWADPAPVTVTWYQHAAAYATMKWPGLAAHSRASVAEALATVTPALTRAAPARPSAAQLIPAPSFGTAQVTGLLTSRCPRHRPARCRKGPPQVHRKSVRGQRKTGAATANREPVHPWPAVAFCRPSGPRWRGLLCWRGSPHEAPRRQPARFRSRGDTPVPAGFSRRPPIPRAMRARPPARQ